MSTFDHDNAAYERWLRRQCRVVEADLRAKHARMRRSAFDFLRATCFRWARTIEVVCPQFSKAPKVLGIVDAHVENFGTWRDAEGRLVWGINDFDEAAVTPYAYDLIRLATSARLAPAPQLDAGDAAAAILAGYRRGLATPAPVLLDEAGHGLRGLFAPDTKECHAFWAEVDDYKEASPPGPVKRALDRSLPKGAQVLRYATRTKGGGSLGRPRYLVIATWQGGRVLREAKALVPSAWDWAHDARDAKPRFLKAALGAYRSPEPGMAVKVGCVIRRVAPDARKLDLADAARQGLSAHLLQAMGAELGAVHAADKRRTRLLDDLESRDPQWLRQAAEAAHEAVQRDFDRL